MTHYLNSKGVLKPIADMAYPHLTAAHAKLLRESPERLAEIAAMAAEIAQRDIEYVAEQAVGHPGGAGRSSGFLDAEGAAAVVAIAEGYPVTVRDGRYVMVENPDYAPDNGRAPRLVIDAHQIRGAAK